MTSILLIAISIVGTCLVGGVIVTLINKSNKRRWINEGNEKLVSMYDHAKRIKMVMLCFLFLVIPFVSIFVGKFYYVTIYILEPVTAILTFFWWKREKLLISEIGIRNNSSETAE